MNFEFDYEPPNNNDMFQSIIELQQTVGRLFTQQNHMINMMQYIMQRMETTNNHPVKHVKSVKPVEKPVPAPVPDPIPPTTAPSCTTTTTTPPQPKEAVVKKVSRCEKKRKIQEPTLASLLDLLPSQYHIDPQWHPHIGLLSHALTCLYVKKHRQLPCFINYVICSWLCKGNWNHLTEEEIGKMFEVIRLAQITEGTTVNENQVPVLEKSLFYSGEFCCVDFTANQPIIEPEHLGNVVLQLHQMDLIQTFVSESKHQVSLEVFVYLCVTILDSIPSLSDRARVFLLALARGKRISNECLKSKVIFKRLLLIPDTPDRSVWFTFVHILNKIRGLLPLSVYTANQKELSTLRSHVKTWKSKSHFKNQLLQLKDQTQSMITPVATTNNASVVHDEEDSSTDFLDSSEEEEEYSERDDMEEDTKPSSNFNENMAPLDINLSPVIEHSFSN